MIFKRVRSNGLAHNSYLIGSADEAMVIDPRRDFQVYVDITQRKGMKIRHIFETHRNEDYVIGSVELASVTKASIYHGPGLNFKYGQTLVDCQEFCFGGLKLRAIRTPGHTDESMSYVLTDLDAGEDPIMVFTGDALFVGDVGRTDLYGPKEAPRLAENLYESIFDRILPLGDDVIVCPAHGAGSICGGNIGSRDQSTLGLERVQNKVLRMSKRDFIEYKVTEHHERPPYFSMMEKFNLEGPPLLGRLPCPDPLSPEEFKEKVKRGAVIVDTRAPPAFGGAHVTDSFSVMMDILPTFAGWVLPYNKPILLILEDRLFLTRVVKYLIRLGFDNLGGYLRSGMEDWYEAAYPIEQIDLITVQELKKRMKRGDELTVLDVRGKDEWDVSHIEGAVHVYIGHLSESLRKIPRDRPVMVICSIGNRASLGASILRREGYREVYNVLGGMDAWLNAGYSNTE